MRENQNRAFMYGESVFTTMKLVNGKVLDWEMHFERLKLSAEFVYGPFEDGEKWENSLKKHLEEKLTQETGSKVLRLSLFREQARGKLKPDFIKVLDLKVDIDTSEFSSESQKTQMTLRSCLAIPRPIWWPSFLKVGNYLETILAQKFFLKPQDTDLLFLSEDGSILESSVANIFVVKNNQLFTAPVGPNVLDGIMRKKVLKISEELFEKVNIVAPKLNEIANAQGIFGTNSVRGPFLIDNINEHEIDYSQEFIKKFEELKSRVF